MQYLKEQVREKILSAARAEFTVNGYSRASIRTIALNSGISLGNIYRYFTDKEALFVAVISDFVDTAAELCEKHFNFDDPSLTGYAALLLQFLDKHRQNLDILLKGPERHVNNFIEQMVDVYARKLGEYLYEVCPAANSALCDTSLYRAVCVSFVNGLAWLLRKDGDSQYRQQEIRDLIWFFFGDAEHKFAHYIAD